MSAADARLPEERVRANRFDLVSRLADDLAHEIKNPLNSAVVNLELVKLKAGTEPETAVERADLVEEAVHRVHELVVALLALLRPAREPTRACDVARTVGQLRTLVEARARLARVELAIDMDDPGYAALPAHHLSQVLLNLLDNAMDGVDESGAIRLTVSGTPDGVALLVEDSGLGLAGDVAGRAFDDGVTTRPGRHGWGLGVCRRLVEQAGGRIVLEPPSVTAGTTVRVTLPRPDGA